jgi:hypothetical protein
LNDPIDPALKILEPSDQMEMGHTLSDHLYYLILAFQIAASCVGQVTPVFRQAIWLIVHVHVYVH